MVKVKGSKVNGQKLVKSGQKLNAKGVFDG